MLLDIARERKKLNWNDILQPIIDIVRAEQLKELIMAKGFYVNEMVWILDFFEFLVCLREEAKKFLVKKNVVIRDSKLRKLNIFLA